MSPQKIPLSRRRLFAGAGTAGALAAAATALPLLHQAAPVGTATPKPPPGAG
ncbi:MAG: formate dehydrogenase, partial [Microbacteriaceae bacterium]|nr:formate dehydrogenase [Burkholderiaceae bacterium]